MNDFLEGVVSRGLGVARVVHRRHEPAFTRTPSERHFDRDGIADIAATEEEACVRPQRRLPPLPELPLRRASDEFLADEGAARERPSMAAYDEPILEGVPSVPTDSDEPRARSHGVTSTRVASSALRRRIAAESTFASRDSVDEARFDVPSQVQREEADDQPVDFGRDVRRGGLEAAEAEKSSAEAHPVRERSRPESRAFDEQPDARSRDVGKDVTFATRRRERAEEAFDAAPAIRNGASNARRVEDEVTINVSIGSIEVARPQPPPVAAPVSPAPPRPSLDDYLQLRDKIRSR